MIHDLGKSARRILAATLSLGLAGCSPSAYGVTYDVDVESTVSHPEALGDTISTASSRLRIKWSVYESGLICDIENETDETVTIVWQEGRFLSGNGAEALVNLTRITSSPESSARPSTVAGGSELEVWIVPRSQVVWSKNEDGSEGGTWGG